MSSRIKLILSAAAMIACLVALHTAQAQISVSQGLDISASTNNPAPGQSVTITVRSFNTNINSAKVIWSVDGKVVQSAIGATTMQVIAPVLGKKITLSVSAVTSEGKTLTNSIIIESGSVDMIIEADGYVPSFFKGKSDAAYQNIIKIVAVPHLADSSGSELDPKTLIYQWKKNDMVISDQSGYGKQYLTLAGDIVPRPYLIMVNVSSRDGSLQGQGMVQIQFQLPSISFYVNDPLYGPLLNLVANDTISIGAQKETGVLAVPFGFNKPSNGLGNLALSWTINGAVHPELASNESIILRAPAADSGVSVIGLDVSNTKNILQHATGGFTATFAAPKTSAPAATF